MDRRAGRIKDGSAIYYYKDQANLCPAFLK